MSAESVDHKAEALRLLGYGRPQDDEGARYAHAAVHALLAIAEGQERVAEELKSIGDLLYRSIEGRAHHV